MKTEVRKATIQPIYKGVQACFELPVSKSEANRWLILQAQFPDITLDFGPQELPEDVMYLKDAIERKNAAGIQLVHLFAGEGGTTFRFLLSWLALAQGDTQLTIGNQLSKRPHQPLFDMLATLGAAIIKVNENTWNIKGTSLNGGILKASETMSTQYYSSLLLVAPSMPLGLKLYLPEKIKESAFLRLTLHAIKLAGLEIEETKEYIYVPFQKINKKVKHSIERDWGAAAFGLLYAMLFPGKKVEFPGLNFNSKQPDSLAVNIFGNLGLMSENKEDRIECIYMPSTAKINKIDIQNIPDIAPSLFFALLDIGWEGKIEGISNLRFKESDRWAWLVTMAEMAGIKQVNSKNEIQFSSIEKPMQMSEFKTNQDHRLAMATAIYALKYGGTVLDPYCVKKSWPGFWNEMKKNFNTTSIIFDP